MQQVDPATWRRHRFGLSAERWQFLDGRSYWITGAGTGFGQSIAVALAAAGAQVFLTGRRAAKLRETLDEACKLGIAVDRCIAIPADLRDETLASAAVGVIGTRTDRLHGLVSCAAIPEPGDIRSPLSNLSMSAWQGLLATNVTAQWLVAKLAGPMLVGNPGARVVLLSSEAGWANTPGFGPYNVTKSALNTLGMSLAAEWARDFPDQDTQVNILVPGEARTEMNQGSADSPYAAVSVTLALLSHPPGGPTGCFFHRDGRHLEFAYAKPYGKDLFSG